MMVSFLSLIIMVTLIPSLLGVLGMDSSFSGDAQKACSALMTSTVNTQTSSGPNYFYAQDHYWSQANADNVPTCIAFPTDAKQVSQVVQILQDYTNVPFAMKSGGHNPNVGFSSVSGGVLISFSSLASTTYNPYTGTADVGPGSRWGQAVSALEPYNVTVVGGRIGDVGVGGLLLGGGLSFLSTQYGLPCDSVVNYEVVLSNATIVNVSATCNPDLFFALHGGGNQFGIVTKFTLKTYPMGQVWGGYRIYDASYSAAILDATHDLITNYPDPKAAVIVTDQITIDTLVEIWIVFYFYDGPTVPAGALDNFMAIPYIEALSDTKARSYSNLVTGNSAFSPYGFRYLIRGTTLPNLPAPQGTNLYNYHYSTWKNYVTGGTLLGNILSLNLGAVIKGLFNSAHIYSFILQPMPYSIPAASRLTNSDGNILGLSPAFGDHVWMSYTISWLSAAADAAAHAVAMNITSSIDAYAELKYARVKNTNYQAGDVAAEEYSPTFMNDGMYDQQVLQSYGESTYQLLKGIQKKYDPVGFFPGRTGGFKYV